ncbi:MAG: folate-binding protein YgfZ [Gammaproteobacteria bacterium]
MNEQWQDFLAQNGAVFEQGRVSDFKAGAFDFAQIEQSTLLVDLSHRGLLKANGADSEVFLQGQFCNDVRRVDAQQSQLSAYCTPKGRILASFRLFRAADDYFLSMHRDVVTATARRLQMFILRSQVTLTDISDEWVQFGVSGPEASRLLGAALGKVPEAANAVVHKDNISCIRTETAARFELFGPLAEMQALWHTLAPACQTVAAHYWTWLDIQAGLPVITAPVVEAFVPQMVNLHWIDGLSFKKGCYPGQEIVARTHYLGKLKRRMYLAHLDGSTCPAAGDEVHRRDDPEGQSAGKVLLSHPAPQGGCDLLVVMQIDAVEAGEIIANRDVDARLHFSALPYPVDQSA